MVGAGNVAWHLAPALENAGHQVVEVYSRDPKNAAALQKQLYSAEVKQDLDFSKSEAELILIAVPDDAINAVAQEIALSEDVTVAHTSGSQPLSALGYLATENIGVFYPLQTFSKARKVSFDHIPFCIEGENKQTIKLLTHLASSLSKRVYNLKSGERGILHVAAVFACNFTNYMLQVSENILKDYKLPPDILHALIAETVQKALEMGPGNAQTGPAKRGDQQTMERHQEFLASYDGDLEQLYQIISEHIFNQYH